MAGTEKVEAGVGLLFGIGGACFPKESGPAY